MWVRDALLSRGGMHPPPTSTRLNYLIFSIADLASATLFFTCKVVATHPVASATHIATKAISFLVMIF